MNSKSNASFFLGVALLLSGGLHATRVHAGVHADESRVHWLFMGGYSEPLGTTADYLQGGFAVGGGVSISPSAGSPLDLRFDLSFSDHQASNQLLNNGQQTTPIQIDGGSGQIWSLTGNVVYHVPLIYGARAYGIAGVGVYHTRIELTQSGYYGGGYYNYCDPFYGYCDGGYGYGDAVVTAHNVTRFGWNAGLGIEFALPYGRSWYVESRYHRINTATPIQFLPIEVGYRF